MEIVRFWLLYVIYFTGMYGFKGGRKHDRKYPTVENVRDEFYKVHDGSIDADASLGEIPLVSKSTFRYYCFIYFHHLFVCSQLCGPLLLCLML